MTGTEKPPAEPVSEPAHVSVFMPCKKNRKSETRMVATHKTVSINKLKQGSCHTGLRKRRVGNKAFLIRFLHALCYAVGAEKALIQVALRVRFPRGKGFIPFSLKNAFLLRNKPVVIIRGSIEHLSCIFQYWKNPHWIIRHCKNLRWKIQRN